MADNQFSFYGNQLLGGVIAEAGIVSFPVASLCLEYLSSSSPFLSIKLSAVSFSIVSVSAKGMLW